LHAPRSGLTYSRLPCPAFAACAVPRDADIAVHGEVLPAAEVLGAVTDNAIRPLRNGAARTARETTVVEPRVPDDALVGAVRIGAVVVVLDFFSQPGSVERTACGL